MIPELLQPFADDLQQYERECVRIDAIPHETGVLIDMLPLKTSKFLGRPFFPKIKEYPKDAQGRPMILIAQLNFEEIPPLEGFPEKGILQLFFSAEDWYDDDYKIIYHTPIEMNALPMTDFSFLKEEDYEESPIHNVHELSFVHDVDMGSTEDSQFGFINERQDFWDFIEDLEDDLANDILQYLDGGGHKLGGYAAFTQSDPREDDIEALNDIQLLQIDSDDAIMFGDCGVGHIFISKEDLAALNFDKAYFYWDCA